MSNWVDVDSDGWDDQPASLPPEHVAKNWRGGAMPPPPTGNTRETRKPAPQRSASPPPTASPFGVEAVDKLAYVDDGTPVELRAGTGIYDSVEKPPQREKPKPRQPQREKKWTPAEDALPKVKKRSGWVGNLLRGIVALALFGGLAYGSYLLVEAYRGSVAPPSTPFPSPTAPATPGAETTTPSPAVSPSVPSS